MKSNGFGRFRQNIIVHVDRSHADEVTTKLEVLPFNEDGEPTQAYFAWSRLTKRPGNDEDVVWDLSVLLGYPGERFDWTVDWNLSKY
ncbi:hypothetical protein QO002_001787 [Pararhizobium capsulatum DSM 1112]|uniref:Uncharacterized protein n=1 Tax=Pararhizobium capsulatum DSM 1112 TaxID=1121113 RepID=A0ABU0BN09_9HYPH|nr:hypothetical protein [Pararhizobium capsulatum]MDQ0319649.1 hypothetical protein [Pararhizobium capsulatum DSM 1112]